MVLPGIAFKGKHMNTWKEVQSGYEAVGGLADPSDAANLADHGTRLS